MVIDVLVEINLNKKDKTFSYKVPKELEKDIKIGKRVLVPFGKQILEGFILGINNNFNHELKDIIISYRLWNLKDIKDNDINLEIIKSLEEYYNIQNLKQRLSENDFLKIKENVFINQDIEFTWPNINKEEIIHSGKCLALKEQIAILVDGTVVPCCLDNNGDIPLGNIFEESIEEILNKPKSITMKKNFEKSIISCELCKTCGFLKRLEDKRNKD